MATPSGRNRNWTAVSFAGQPIDGVTRIRYSPGLTRVKFAGDTDLYPSSHRTVMADPSFRVSLKNRYGLVGLSANTKGIFTYTHLDARNLGASGGGAILVTTNALSMIGDRPAEDQYNMSGTQEILITTCSSDGVTNPVSTALL